MTAGWRWGWLAPFLGMLAACGNEAGLRAPRGEPMTR